MKAKRFFLTLKLSLLIINTTINFEYIINVFVKKQALLIVFNENISRFIKQKTIFFTKNNSKLISVH